MTSAGHADGYVVSTLAADADDTDREHDLFVLNGDTGVSVAGIVARPGHARQRQRADVARRRSSLGADRALTAPGKGLDMMLGVVLPAFQVGTAAVAIGIAEAAVQATIGHVTNTRLEHMNSSLADLPTLRAQIARMRIETDRARAHLGAVLDSLETPGPATQLMVLEAKAVGDRSRRRRHRPGDADLRRRRVRRSARHRADVPRRAGADRDGADERSGLRLHRPGAVRTGGVLMDRPLKVGAVMYDPKVSVIWEIIRDFFEAQACPIDVAFYSTYEAAGRRAARRTIDIAWNSPLAWLDSQRRSGGTCRAIAMRDTDRDRVSYFVARRRRAGAHARRPAEPDAGDRRERLAAGDADSARTAAAGRPRPGDRPHHPALRRARRQARGSRRRRARRLRMR